MATFIQNGQEFELISVPEKKIRTIWLDSKTFWELFNAVPEEERFFEADNCSDHLVLEAKNSFLRVCPIY